MSEQTQDGNLTNTQTTQDGNLDSQKTQDGNLDTRNPAVSGNENNNRLSFNEAVDKKVAKLTSEAQNRAAELEAELEQYKTKSMGEFEKKEYDYKKQLTGLAKERDSLAEQLKALSGEVESYRTFKNDTLINKTIQSYIQKEAINPENVIKLVKDSFTIDDNDNVIHKDNVKLDKFFDEYKKNNPELFRTVNLKSGIQATPVSAGSGNGSITTADISGRLQQLKSKK